MKIIKETAHLAFILPDENEGVKQPKKTKLIAIVNTRNKEIIGEIKWFGKWRRYSFFPYMNTVWDIGCLESVREVISDLTLERFAEKDKAKI